MDADEAKHEAKEYVSGLEDEQAAPRPINTGFRWPLCLFKTRCRSGTVTGRIAAEDSLQIRKDPGAAAREPPILVRTKTRPLEGGSRTSKVWRSRRASLLHPTRITGPCVRRGRSAGGPPGSPGSQSGPARSSDAGAFDLRRLIHPCIPRRGFGLLSAARECGGRPPNLFY